MSINSIAQGVARGASCLLRSNTRCLLGASGPITPTVCSPNLARFESNKHQSPQVRRYIDIALRELEPRGIKEDSDFHSQNAFKLFNLEQKFTINQSKVKRELRTIMVLLHPDKFVCKDEESQRISERLSSLVNEAYSTLMNPYKRARYLLSLSLGKRPEEIEGNLEHMTLEPDFLNRMMELREKIETSRQDEVLRLKAHLDGELSDVIAQVKRHFESEDYDSILKKLGKLKFLTSCNEACERRIGRMGNF